jgi:hypothetical protein
MRHEKHSMAAGDFPTLVLDSPRNIDVALAQNKRGDGAQRNVPDKLF